MPLIDIDLDVENPLVTVVPGGHVNVYTYDSISANLDLLSLEKVTALTGDEILPILQDGESKQVTSNVIQGDKRTQAHGYNLTRHEAYSQFGNIPLTYTGTAASGIGEALPGEPFGIYGFNPRVQSIAYIFSEEYGAIVLQTGDGAAGDAPAKRLALPVNGAAVAPPKRLDLAVNGAADVAPPLNTSADAPHLASTTLFDGAVDAPPKSPPPVFGVAESLKPRRPLPPG